jgi:hypothetical protein
MTHILATNIEKQRRISKEKIYYLIQNTSVIFLQNQANEKDYAAFSLTDYSILVASVKQGNYLLLANRKRPFKTRWMACKEIKMLKGN